MEHIYNVSSKWMPLEHEVGGIKLAVFREPTVIPRLGQGLTMKLQKKIDAAIGSLITVQTKQPIAVIENTLKILQSKEG